MPQDMKVWRKNARAKLIAELGGKCVDCGTTENLEFDHKVPLTDEQQDYRVRIGSNMRICLYRREAREDLLALRCERCNIRKARAGHKQGTFGFDTPVVNYNNPF
jgi:5-methylcytosine-specific restriction endonuclease McrA